MEAKTQTAASDRARAVGKVEARLGSLADAAWNAVSDAAHYLDPLNDEGDRTIVLTLIAIDGLVRGFDARRPWQLTDAEQAAGGHPIVQYGGPGKFSPAGKALVAAVDDLYREGLTDGEEGREARPAGGVDEAAAGIHPEVAVDAARGEEAEGRRGLPGTGHGAGKAAAMTPGADDAPTCRACGAPIRWATTVNDKAMPLDFDPVEDGTFVIIGPTRVDRDDIVRLTEIRNDWQRKPSRYRDDANLLTRILAALTREAESVRAEATLAAIRAHAGTIWDAHDCKTAAVTYFDGEDAGRNHALTRDESSTEGGARGYEIVLPDEPCANCGGSNVGHFTDPEQDDPPEWWCPDCKTHPDQPKTRVVPAQSEASR